jgi:hypothetical protein
MPPPAGQRPSQAVFIRRDEMAQQLDHPLNHSLAPRTPSVRTIRLSPDAGLVDRLTGGRMFSFSLTQANTANRGFLVLDPIVVPTPAAQVPARKTRKQAAKQSRRQKKKQQGG